MSDTVITVDGLSKRYRIGKRAEVRDMLRESLANAVRGVAGGARRFRGDEGNGDQQVEDYWALKHVSFEVRRGEVVGIIGRNGAGKSTLLKILSRITEPTSGRAVLRGRVGSLLEVGTGFHPELTGRENIYLSGAILGMRKVEINRKFDEIVAFSGVEKFLDTPIKRYSSGMNVRLGFAVAAHLDPEILLVDEVLAVGDAEFQKKCLGKMEAVSKGGRTVLFVSHNMAAVQALCSRVLLLGQGTLHCDSLPSEVITSYVDSFAVKNTGNDLTNIQGRKGAGPLRFAALRLLGRTGEEVAVCQTGKPTLIALDYSSSKPLAGKNVMMAIVVKKMAGDELFICQSSCVGQRFSDLRCSGTVCCKIPKLPLRGGRYLVNLFCTVNDIISDWLIEAVRIDVIEGDFFGTGKMPPPGRSPILVDHGWEAGPTQDSVA